MRPLQKQIIETLKVQPKIDVQEEVKRTIQFLKEYLFYLFLLLNFNSYSFDDGL